MKPPHVAAAALLAVAPAALAAPNSKPYVAYRTVPFDEDAAKRYETGKRAGDAEGVPRPRSRTTTTHRGADEANAAAGSDGSDGEEGDSRCPLSFRIGLSTSGPGAGGSTDAAGAKPFAGGRNAVRSPPVIHPIHPASGPGRQILYSTVWERLDMLNPVPPGVAAEASRGGADGPISFEGMSADSQFPLLLESANLYYAEPIVHDTNGDGVPEAILVDYDGLVVFAGLDYDPLAKDTKPSDYQRRTRFYHAAQIPRLYVRKNWVECATNKTKEEEMQQWDPYHSYFEYGVEWNEEYDSKRIGKVVSGNVVEQDLGDANELDDVKKKRKEWTEERVKAEEEAKTEREEEAKRKEEEEAKTKEEDEAKAKEAKTKEEEEAKTKEDAEEKEKDDAAEKQEEQEKKEAEGDAEKAAEGEAEKVAEADAHKDKDANEKKDGGDTANEADKATGDGAKDGNDKGDAPEVKDVEPDQNAAAEGRRRLQEVPPDANDPAAAEVDSDQNADGGDNSNELPDDDGGSGEEGDDFQDRGDSHDDPYPPSGDEYPSRYSGDEGNEGGEGDMQVEDGEYGEDGEYPTDDEYPGRGGGYDDDYHRGGMYDDHYGGRYGGREEEDHYSDSNYIRIPPHVLSRPVLVEIPKRYKATDDDEHAKEEFLVVAASYYFDEDEFEGVQSYRRFRNKDGGDETPTKRGYFMASAILIYNVADKRWETQEHLDLSTDLTSPANLTVGDAEVHMNGHNGMMAMALAGPVVAYLGGNDRRHRIVVGTSMGLLYALDVPTAYTANGFPVQFDYPIVRRALVEDVAGDSEVEIIALDEGGNVVCLKGEDASTIWHRDLLAGGERDDGAMITATSEMTMGDVDGDGTVDVVLAVRTQTPTATEVRVYALDGATGDDVPNFPLVLESTLHDAVGNDDDMPRYGGNTQDLVQPLLVDLHASQGYWAQHYSLDNAATHSSAAEKRADLRKLARAANERAASGTIAPLRPLHGGNALGLHVVQPLGSDLHIVEGGTGCAQRIGVGETVGAAVQVDDVHGTGTLDLIVTTTSGRVLTLEVPESVPYHPLNVWGAGSSRGAGTGGHAQGYSASMGIFVHPDSRRYRDWLGLYVPVTFEIFDRAAAPPPPKTTDEDGNETMEGENTGSARNYMVEIRAGTSHKRAFWRKVFDATGTYTERVFIPHGPGYYALTVRMTSENGITYEDTFHVGYNVNYTAGLAWLVLVPLFVAAVPLLLYRRTPNWEEDEDYGGSGGILGRTMLD